MRVLLIAVVAVFAAEVRADVDVETLAGQRVVGAVVALSADGVTIRDSDGETKLAAADVARVTFGNADKQASGKAAAWIELVDGSQLVAGELTRTKGKFSWRSLLDPAGSAASTLEGRDVRTVRFQAADEAVLGRFAEIAAKKASGDQIVIRRGETTIDALAGIVRDMSSDAVQFEIDGEVRAVPMKRVFGLVFYQPVGRELKKTACVATDSAGSRFAAAALELADGKVTITTPAGLEFVRPLDALARIDFTAAKTLYLGEVNPESIEYASLVGEPSDELKQLFQPRVDRALFGGPLQLPREANGRSMPAWPYAKGLAIHSRTKIVYRLPREFRSFSAIAGIDSRVRPAGNVRLVIHGDDKELYAGTIAGKDAPVALSLDMQGVRRLTILVDFGEDLDVADHLNLCEAKLIE